MDKYFEQALRDNSPGQMRDYHFSTLKRIWELFKYEKIPQNGAILVRKQKGMIILELLNLIKSPGRYSPDPI